jgi:hypothetical protein
MEISSHNNQSFVIKVWLESGAEESGGARWRGHITHVSSGERRYMEDLDEIAAFVDSYLRSMGVRHDWLTKINRVCPRVARLLRQRLSHR